jgi:hypothetical protein
MHGMFDSEVVCRMLTDLERQMQVVVSWVTRVDLPGLQKVAPADLTQYHGAREKSPYQRVFRHSRPHLTLPTRKFGSEPDDRRIISQNAVQITDEEENKAWDSRR